MRRGFILFVGILALALAPALVSAQYSGAFGLSGLPSMPSMFGGSSKCGEPVCPAFAPAVYFGWGVPQDRNTSVSLMAQNNGAANVREVTIKLPTNGFWLGAALPVSLGDNLSFVATGWYLFPGTPSANSNEDVGLRVPGDTLLTTGLLHLTGGSWMGRSHTHLADPVVAEPPAAQVCLFCWG